MTRFILTICAVLCLFPSCKKHADKKSSVIHSIIGAWELRIGYNGWGGHTTYPPGNGTILKYTATDYELHSQFVLTKKGKYKVIRDSSFMMQQLSDRLIYDNVYTDFRTFIQISNDTLSLSIDAYDGPGTVYVRIPQ